MAVITLRPSGDGTTTGWTRISADGTFASKIVDDPDSHDSDTSYVLSPNVADGQMWVSLDDVPGDFDPASINSITLKAAAKKINTPAMAVDTSDLYLQLERTDESTDISAESSVCNVTDTANYVLFTRTVAGTGTHTITDWNGAKLRLRFDHITAQTVDTVNQIRITAAEVVIDYNPQARTGTLSKTLGDLTVDSEADLEIKGIVDESLGALTLYALGGAGGTAFQDDAFQTDAFQIEAGDDRTATLSKTLGALTLDGEGKLDINATLSKTLGELTLEGEGDVEIKGTFDKTLGALTLESDGTSFTETLGTLDKILGALTLESDAALEIKASVDKTLGILELDSAGALEIKATLSKTLGALTVDSDAALAIAGTLDESLGALTLSSAAALEIKASLDKTLGALTLESEGSGLTITVGDLVQTLGALTLDSDGKLDIAASLAKTLGALTLESDAKLDLIATLSKTLGALTLESEADLSIVGSLSKTLGTLTIASQGQVEIKGSLDKTLGALTLSAAGGELQQTFGTLNQPLGALVLSASGAQWIKPRYDAETLAAVSVSRAEAIISASGETMSDNESNGLAEAA